MGARNQSESSVRALGGFLFVGFFDVPPSFVCLLETQSCSLAVWELPVDQAALKL